VCKAADSVNEPGDGMLVHAARPGAQSNLQVGQAKG